MRILIISTFFPPLNSIASLRPYSWAKYWSIAGHEVTVLTIKRDPDEDPPLNLPNPGYEVLEVPAHKLFYSLKKRHSSTPQKKDSFRTKITDYLRYQRGIFNACRMPDLTDLWVKPAWNVIREKGGWDLVVSTAGPYTPHLLACKIKRKKLADKWIADYRDPWTNSRSYPGIFPLNMVEKILERRLMRAADIITTVTTPLAAEFATKYGSRKVFTIENGFDPIDLKRLPEDSIFPDDNKHRIIHTGSLTLDKQDLLLLFQAIHNIHQDPFLKYLLNGLEVIFVGHNLSELERLIEEHHVSPWIKTQGFVSREKALRMQRDAHALLYLPRRDRFNACLLPGKLFEYLYSQTPIIILGGKGVQAPQQMILDSKAGEILTDVEQIKDYLIDKLVNVRKEKIRTNQSFLDRYNRQTLAMKLLDLVPQS